MKKPDNELIEKVWAGLASLEQAKEVALWLATDEGQDFVSKHFEQEAERGSDEVAELLVDHEIPTEEMLLNIETRLRKRRMKTFLWRVAAVVLPVVFVLGLSFYLDSRMDLFGRTQYEEVHVPRGERMQMIFQDGSKIYLNADSYLRYPSKFGLDERRVELHGEAYFEVTKNKHRPFVVQLDESSIKVLGTSFNVNAYPDDEHIVIHLDEGKINVAFESDEEVQVSPGESLIYNKSTNEFTINRMSHPELTSVWKENIIAFREEAISDVFTKLERWFDVRFVNSEHVFQNLRITLESRQSSLNDVLNDLEKITNLSFEYNKNSKEVSVH